MYGMLAKCKTLCLPIDIQCDLYKQPIVPILFNLLYGCEIWGLENLEQIEVFHRKFSKDLLHLRKSTPHSMIYGETGESRLSSIVECRTPGVD